MLESIRPRWTLRKLTQDWITYRSFIEEKLGSPGVTPADEEEFLRLKARIAARIPQLAASVPPAAAQDAQKQFALMTESLNRHRTLRLASPLQDKEREELDRAWHQHFIFLNKLRGIRLGTPQVRASIGRSGGAMPTGMPSYRRRRLAAPGMGLLRFAFRLLIFIVVVYVLGRTIGVARNEAGQVALQPPTSVNGAVANFIEGSRAVGGLVGQIFSPVVAAYGIEATLILVGILVLGIGYLIFVRG